MYADSSVKLKKKSELSQESAVAACKMYIPYISDITRQIDKVVKIFAMEKELRSIKNSLLPSATVGTRRVQDRNNPGQRGTNERNR